MIEKTNSVTKATETKTSVNWDEDRNEVELTKEEIETIRDFTLNNPAPIDKIFGGSREEMYTDAIYKAKCDKWAAENGLNPINLRLIKEDDELIIL